MVLYFFRSLRRRRLELTDWEWIIGIGFGIFWATAVSEMDDLFPPEQRAVAQGILGALHQGLGTGLGAMIGGYLYEYYGAIWLFHSVIGLAVVSITIFCLGRLSRF